MPKDWDAISERKKNFAREYVKDFHGEKAAIRAGYAPNSAKSQASRLLTDDNLRAYLVTLKEEKAKMQQIDAAFVLERFMQIADRCMTVVPVLDEDGNETGEYKFEAQAANKALENIGKHIGFYEVDNEQKGAVTLNIVNYADVEDNDDISIEEL